MLSRMPRVLGAAAALLMPLVLAFETEARDLTVANWGGEPSLAQQKVYFTPYQNEKGIPVAVDSYTGGLGILRTKASANVSDWDIVQIEAEEAEIGCAEGLFEPLDWSVIGPEKDFMPQAHHECAIGAIVWSTGLIYDSSKLASAPTSWADFWDLKKYPGKRGMRSGPKFTLEFALMADGVPAADVYKQLRTPEGVDRAFHKLDEIKKEIVWWTGGSQAPQLVISGEVAMSVGYSSRVAYNRIREGKALQFAWPDSIYAVDSWAILKNSPLKSEALQLIRYVTRAEVQSKLPPLSYQGATNIEAARLSTENNAELAQVLPTANMDKALALDVQFWIDNIDELTQRFNAWAAQ